jgi:hypothetical protein
MDGSGQIRERNGVARADRWRLPAASRNRNRAWRKRNRYASSGPPRDRFFIDPVVDAAYTTAVFRGVWVAFLRRRGNAYYLVHNVRWKGKVKQLHLACLGERPRLTDEVIRKVRREYAFLEVNWTELRRRMSRRVDLLVADGNYLSRLARDLRKLNLELADLAPQWLGFGADPEATRELLSLLKLLRSTVEIKLRQFERAPFAAGSRRDLQ